MSEPTPEDLANFLQDLRDQGAVNVSATRRWTDGLEEEFVDGEWRPV